MGKTRTRYGSLREYLSVNRITQQEFAARIGVTQGAISKVVNRQSCSLPMALRIVREARVPLESLVRESCGEGATA